MGAVRSLCFQDVFVTDTDDHTQFGEMDRKRNALLYTTVNIYSYYSITKYCTTSLPSYRNKTGNCAFL